MIQAFRHIAYGGSARELRGRTRVAAHIVRFVALLNILVFFSDTINVNILYAAILGDVQFQDNPYILDSATDSTNIAPNIVTPHVNYFELAKFDGGPTNVSRHGAQNFCGTTIVEDEDSPGTLAGDSTATLTYDIRSYAPTEAATLHERAAPVLDRTITFGCLQI